MIYTQFKLNQNINMQIKGSSNKQNNATKLKFGSNYYYYILYFYLNFLKIYFGFHCKTLVSKLKQENQRKTNYAVLFFLRTKYEVRH